jgi:WhiB family redox-sensing transcriptional regulator
MALHDAIARDTWKLMAACRGVDSNVFYPETDDAAGPAKAVCGRCPVRLVCLQSAIRNRERYGVWGGLTEGERSRLGRDGARAA